MSIPSSDLQARLEQLGSWGGVGQRRRATAHFHTCGQVVMSGLDDHTCAAAVLADPAPLDVAGELAALLAGRGTYRLRWLAGHYELDARDDFHIAAEPPRTRDRLGRHVEVLAAHRCHQALSTAHLSEPVTARSTDDHPPY